MHNYSDKEVGLLHALGKQMGYRSQLPFIDDFLESDFYLGGAIPNVYPKWREVLREIYPNPYYTPYDLVCFGGAIGLGKSTVSCIGILYDLMKLFELKDIFDKYRISSATTTLCLFLLSVTIDKAKQVLAQKIEGMIDASPYFSKYIEVTAKGKKTYLETVKLIYGRSSQDLLGMDALGGIMTEANFKDSGTALDDFAALILRINSRFLADKEGQMPMHFFVDSSANDESDFTQKLVDDNKDNERFKLFEYAQWEVLDFKRNFSGEKFPVFKGSLAEMPKIIVDSEKILYESKDIIYVPIEFKKDFVSDTSQALRGLAGISVASTGKFFTNLDMIKSSMSLTNLFTKNIIELEQDTNTRIVAFLDVKELAELDQNYYIHFDIGTSKDMTGISISYLQDVIYDKETDNVISYVISVPAVLGIKPIRGSETRISWLYDFIMDLTSNDISIDKVTVDSYQSKSLQQELKHAGYECDIISVDKTKDAYYKLKQLVIEGHVNIAYSDILYSEMVGLIENEKKIDHTARGSKDISDAVAGSVLTCANMYLESEYEQQQRDIKKYKLMGQSTPELDKIPDYAPHQQLFLKKALLARTKLYK